MRTVPARRVASMDEIVRPGDYYGPTDTYSGTDRGVWFLLPIADPDNPFDVWPEPPDNRAQWVEKRRNGLHRVAEPPWVFRECPDGSLEIRESIVAGRGTQPDETEYFHGYLDEGNVWRIL